MHTRMIYSNVGNDSNIKDEQHNTLRGEGGHEDGEGTGWTGFEDERGAEWSDFGNEVVLNDEDDKQAEHDYVQARDKAFKGHEMFSKTQRDTAKSGARSANVASVVPLLHLRELHTNPKLLTPVNRVQQLLREQNSPSTRAMLDGQTFGYLRPFTRAMLDGPTFRNIRPFTRAMLDGRKIQNICPFTRAMLDGHNYESSCPFSQAEYN
ncbi:hypothetical protein SCHPADRAFT_947283 [Schizopora paradoxa]|uniref:Uncharacterized protein n=1 Tax=Schizopora paradoxa TaxID=27342 RepID=A0A0H2R6B2_9AGAM|nr:hypothetical protein SCHPADRAFT_947283 [Schizopora paradoxa]